MRYLTLFFFTFAPVLADSHSLKPITEMCRIYNSSQDIYFVDAEVSRKRIDLVVKTKNIKTTEYKLNFVQCVNDSISTTDFQTQGATQPVRAHKNISPFLWVEDSVYYFNNAVLDSIPVTKRDLRSKKQRSVASEIKHVQLIEIIEDPDIIYALSIDPLERALSVIEFSIEENSVKVLREEKVSVSDHFQITDYLNIDDKILISVEKSRSKTGYVYSYGKEDGEYKVYDSCGPSKFVDVTEDRITLLGYRRTDKAALCLIDKQDGGKKWMQDLFDVSYSRFGEQSVFPIFYDRRKLYVLDGGFGKVPTVHSYRRRNGQFLKERSMRLVSEKVRDVHVRRHGTAVNMFVKYVKYVDGGKTETSGLVVLKGR